MRNQPFSPLCSLVWLMACAAPTSFAQAPPSLTSADVVAFLGGTNLIQLQRDGTLEALWCLANSPERPRFRDFCWDGDTVERQGTVIERWRQDKFGNLARQLDTAQVSVVVLQFGQSEALDPTYTPARFSSSLGQLLDQLGAREIVLLTPTPLEQKGGFLPDLSAAQHRLHQIAEVTRQAAAEREAHFVDLIAPFSHGADLTDNGLHVMPAHQPRVAREIAKQLRLPSKLGSGRTEAQRRLLRKAITTKHELWMSYWRPANWKCLYGDDGQREFGKSTNGGPTLREEWSQLPGLVARAEATIWKLAELTP